MKRTTMHLTVVITLVLAVALTLGFSGCPKVQLSKTDLVKGADDLYASGDLDQAIAA